MAQKEPMNSAPYTPELPDAGVMPTSPARAPDSIPRLLGRLNKNHSNADQARTPAEDATCVTISA